MQKHVSTKRVLLFAVAAVAIADGIGALPALAQAAAAGKTHAPIDIAITYQAARETQTTSSFFLQGGAIELHAPLYRGFGVVASITGEHAGTGTTGGAPLDMVLATFGPRYTFAPTHRTAVFGEALVGEANAFHSVFPGNSGSTTAPNTGSTDSANSLAVLVGGGVDIKVTPHIAVRALQADWQRTQLPNSRNNVQNGLRIGAGVVFKWGHQ